MEEENCERAAPLESWLGPWRIRLPRSREKMNSKILVYRIFRKISMNLYIANLSKDNTVLSVSARSMCLASPASFPVSWQMRANKRSPSNVERRNYFMLCCAHLWATFFDCRHLQILPLDCPLSTFQYCQVTLLNLMI